MMYGAVDIQNALIMAALAIAAGAVIYVRRHWGEMTAGWKKDRETRELESRSM